VEASEDRGGATLRLLMVVALYAIPLVVALRPVAAPVFDPDVWWHLRVGQWVVEQGTLPATDPFARLDQPWVAYSWLYEVLLYGLYLAFGLAGVIVYRVALSLAVVAAVHRLVAKREPRFLVATALTGGAVLALAMLFSERPWLFTILFATLTLSAVLDFREERPGAWFWVLPAIYALWANIHIQFIYGLFILALACAAPVLERFGARMGWLAGGDEKGWRGWWQLVLLAGLCALATLVNPYHMRLYGVVLEYATQPGPFRFVNELKALEFREPCDWMVLALGGAAAFFLGRRRKLDLFKLLLLVSSAFFAFRARRDLWFLVLAALAILSTTGAVASSAERFTLTWRRLAAVMVLLVGIGAVTAIQRDLSAEALERTVASKFPVQAAAVVAERGDDGPLYNDFNWGGYLIWALPHLPAAIDGRTNLHGDERIERFGAVWSGAPGWEADPDLSAAGVVIAPAESALASLLRQDGRFKLVHEDEVAVVFVARARERSVVLPRPLR
jgi:hypothetical protein